jgi:2-dehydro-3-deoxygluconokinase
MSDVVTLGETQVRFTPPGTLRLEQANVWEVTPPGGAEANVAVGLARLGVSPQPCWRTSQASRHGGGRA